VAGLDLMAGGLKRARTVLVLGCGPVGRWSVEALLGRKARVCVWSIGWQKSRGYWPDGPGLTFHTTIQVGR
jgi:S-adenosylhomocysteine hydrolase